MKPFPNDPSSSKSLSGKNEQSDKKLKALAADILGFLAEDTARLSRFFDLTGLAPQTLRESAAAPGFEASLFDYLASDDRLFLAFATARHYDLKELEGLRQGLAHGATGDD